MMLNFGISREANSCAQSLHLERQKSVVMITKAAWAKFRVVSTGLLDHLPACGHVGSNGPDLSTGTGILCQTLPMHQSHPIADQVGRKRHAPRHDIKVVVDNRARQILKPILARHNVVICNNNDVA